MPPTDSSDASGVASGTADARIICPSRPLASGLQVCSPAGRPADQPPHTSPNLMTMPKRRAVKTTSKTREPFDVMDFAITLAWVALAMYAIYKLWVLGSDPANFG
jgi:hypothetical protein